MHSQSDRIAKAARIDATMRAVEVAHYDHGASRVIVQRHVGRCSNRDEQSMTIKTEAE